MGGLTMIRRLEEIQRQFGLNDLEIKCFEQAGEVGGTWIYRKQYDENFPGLYDLLHTNLPKQIMEFEDFSFQQHEKLQQQEQRKKAKEEEKSSSDFISRNQVLEYIQNYAKTFISTETRNDSIQLKSYRS